MAKAKDRTQEQKPKSGLLKRLFKLCVLLVVAGGVGLALGYKFQEPIRLKSGAEIATGKWVWEDPAGFVQYAKHWGGIAKEEAQKVQHEAEALDARYGISDKAKAAGEKVKDTSVALYEKAKDQLEDQPAPESGPDASALDAEQRESHLGFTEAELTELPAGFYESYKAGLESEQQGIDAYGRSHQGSPGWEANLKKAKQKFEAAFAHYDKALKASEDTSELSPSARAAMQRQRQIILDRQGQLQERFHDISKRSPATY